jgi:hypothetical protein
MNFRITTADGVQHELEAEDMQAAIEAVEAEGCPWPGSNRPHPYALEQVISAWYFNSVYGHWMSGDNLLKAYKVARNFEE